MINSIILMMFNLFTTTFLIWAAVFSFLSLSFWWWWKSYQYYSLGWIVQQLSFQFRSAHIEERRIYLRTSKVTQKPRTEKSNQLRVLCLFLETFRGHRDPSFYLKWLFSWLYTYFKLMNVGQPACLGFKLFWRTIYYLYFKFICCLTLSLLTVQSPKLINFLKLDTAPK